MCCRRRSSSRRRCTDRLRDRGPRRACRARPTWRRRSTGSRSRRRCRWPGLGGGRRDVLPLPWGACLVRRRKGCRSPVTDFPLHLHRRLVSRRCSRSRRDSGAALLAVPPLLLAPPWFGEPPVVLLGGWLVSVVPALEPPAPLLVAESAGPPLFPANRSLSASDPATHAPTSTPIRPSEVKTRALRMPRA